MSNYSDDKNPYQTRPLRRDHYLPQFARQNMIDAYKEGFLAAEKDLGWHRNCEETPVPRCELPALFLIMYKGQVGIPRANLDGAFELQDGSIVFLSEVDFWLEIPMIPKDIIYWRKSRRQRNDTERIC